MLILRIINLSIRLSLAKSPLKIYIEHLTETKVRMVLYCIACCILECTINQNGFLKCRIGYVWDKMRGTYKSLKQWVEHTFFESEEIVRIIKRQNIHFIFIFMRLDMDIV